MIRIITENNQSDNLDSIEGRLSFEQIKWIQSILDMGLSFISVGLDEITYGFEKNFQQDWEFPI